MNFQCHNIKSPKVTTYIDQVGRQEYLIRVSNIYSICVAASNLFMRATYIYGQLGYYFLHCDCHILIF